MASRSSSNSIGTRGGASALKPRILEAAWEQIARDGAAGLSLRAIARSLKVTAPAIYNHFPDRDALVTAMIIDAYTEFSASQAEVAALVPEEDATGRLMATGLAYRSWALEHPERYELIFGSPIPGYVEPADQVQPVAARALGPMLQALDALRKQDRFRLAQPVPMPKEQLTRYQRWLGRTEPMDALVFGAATLIWARLHGLVSLEIRGALPPGDGLYMHELQAIAMEYTQEPARRR